MVGLTFNECIELGLGLNECNALTEPSPNLLVVATVVAIAILIGLKAYRHHND